jgi:type I restriction enzyme S subunit
MRPYLRVANVLDDILDLSDIKQMNFTPAEWFHYSLHFGDILLNEGQSPELVGRSAIYRSEVDNCCFQKTLLRFRPSGIATSEFAQIVFQHYLHSLKFQRLAPITTNIAHLTQVRFVAMEFPVPPIEEQDVIVEIYRSSVGAIRDFEILVLNEDRKALRQSILKSAFEGGLVPQDPHEEPASELLSRIRAQPSAPQPSRRRKAAS